MPGQPQLSVRVRRNVVAAESFEARFQEPQRAQQNWSSKTARLQRKTEDGLKAKNASKKTYYCSFQTSLFPESVERAPRPLEQVHFEPQTLGQCFTDLKVCSLALPAVSENVLEEEIIRTTPRAWSGKLAYLSSALRLSPLSTRASESSSHLPAYRSCGAEEENSDGAVGKQTIDCPPGDLPGNQTQPTCLEQSREQGQDEDEFVRQMFDCFHKEQKSSRPVLDGQKQVDDDFVSQMFNCFNKEQTDSHPKPQNQKPVNEQLGRLLSGNLDLERAKGHETSSERAESHLSANGDALKAVMDRAINGFDFWETEFPLVLKKIGTGSFGQVFVGRWHMTQVAIKVMDIGCKPIQVWDTFCREIKFHYRLHHPNIVRFLGACTRNEKQPALLLELCERGSLYDLIRRARSGAGTFEWSTRLRYALDAARAMVFLHSKKVIHRDLKTPNLLVDRGNVCKVSDFGMSRFTTGVETDKVEGLNPRWAAPELLRGEKYGQSVDVYSFGTVLWELATLQFPFQDLASEDASLAYLVEQGLHPTFPQSWEEGCQQSVPQGYVELSQDCWAHPSKRPSFVQIATRLENMSKSLKAMSHATGSGSAVFA
ncbi:hypothetical protein CYMTET_38155 [Cymbomonas tetramitiformis]|uniref:Protein kinase domain-containing protein n=1 Tax=Cymbomonas tetramitiformis TaxID=36881 RepID=A0AAE0F582_9CHLO|nr:hypothetical protein CYMTET_38155 [Cymbomonas tetramitiformis]